MSAERIEVPIGRNGETKVFDSISELDTWVNQERAFWSWLEIQQPYSEPKQAAWQRYGTFFGNMQQHLQQAKGIQADNTQALQRCFENIKNAFITCYVNQMCFHAGTPLGKFLAQVRKEDGDGIAAGVLIYSMRGQFNAQNTEMFKGALIGFAFETGIRERKPNEFQALDEMRLEWEKKFQSFRDGLQTETDTHKRLNSEGQQLISKQDDAFKELLKKQNSTLSEMVVKYKTEWSELKKTYDDALALRSPVTYWTKKARSHLNLSWTYAVVAALAVGASLLVLIPEIQTMMKPPTGVQDLEKWHPEYWRMAVVIASALFCVWVVRILVRLLLSNIHLHTDARERVVMIQTYLALLRRGKLKDEEGMFILQALFRPTPTGIVKDDAVPLTIVEGITKLGR
jgi:hypothetical protein